MLYKNSIPLEIRREILKAYDSIPGINSNMFGNAKVFKRVLKNMGKSRYNQSIASLVRERSDEKWVPVFTGEEIEFIRQKYKKLLDYTPQLRLTGNIKKNQNFMHCRYYIVKIVQKYLPNKKYISAFVVPPTD